MHSRTTHRFQNGFSLLELSIALAVIGIVVAGGLTMSTSMVDRQAYVQTSNQMQEVDKALAAFVAVNDRLPCPSNPALALSDSNFGKEQAGCAGTINTPGTGGKAVRIGGLPVRSLGLRDRMAADEYGNRYTYAVTANLTSDAENGGYRDPAEVGAISMADADIHDVAYVVVSHGGDNKGAYRYETANNTVTCISGLDQENCNNDATFRDTRFNRGTVAGFWFDDTVRFARKEMINLTAGGASAGGSQFWAADGDHIYNTNIGNVGIGAAAGMARLSVYSADTQDVLRLEGRNGSANVLDIDSAMGENGIRLVTKGTQRSLQIDNVGTGTGIELTMNNDGTGIYVRKPAGTTAGIYVEGANESGGLIHAETTSDDPNSAAILGYTTGSESHGVYGHATAIDATGVYGQGAVGVSGSTPITTSNGIGVYGQAMQQANAVRGEHSGAGNGNAGYFRTSGGSGTAVRGLAESTTGATFGGFFANASNAGAALRADANAISGSTYSGIFNNSSTGGTGILIDAPSGTGMVSNGLNWGVIGRAHNTGNINATGVSGTSMAANGIGVEGSANSSAGGAPVGVNGQTSSSTGIGVRGLALSATGINQAGFFMNNSTSGTAVFANATALTGFTYGFRSSVQSVDGVGIYADVSASSGSARGVSGRARSPSGVAVEGYNLAATGNAYGLYGNSASATGWSLRCEGAGQCGGNKGWTNNSDIRLKDHVQTLADHYGLDAIRKLHPVTYEWKDAANKVHGTQIGFIAQEVEKVLPEMVTTGSDQHITLAGGKKETIRQVKAMGYAELTAPLVRAVQQLADKLDALFESVKTLIAQVNGHDADITALKADNAKLKADNDALKARLDVLEAKLK